MDFIDIRGASGTTYRFRRWPEVGAHPPIAGNFALVAWGSQTLIHLGVLDDLSQAPRVSDTLAPGADLFTRFNVSRRHREAEHADMAQQHPDVGGSERTGAAGQAA